MQRHIFRNAVFLALMLVQLAFSQAGKRSIIVEADGYVYLSEDKTIRQIRNEAQMQAKRAALEKGGEYIESVTTVENYKLIMDQIKSRAEGLLKTLESKDHGFTADNRYHFWIKAEISYLLPTSAKRPDPKDPSPKQPLSVKIWPAKKKYKSGEQMRFYIRGNKDFYARVIYIDAQGNKLQLIPNQFNKDNFFKGGTTIAIPGKNDGYQLTVAPPYGKEKVIVYASSSPQGEVDTKPAGNTLLSVEADIKEIGLTARGVSLEAKKGVEFYETKCHIKTGG